MTYTWFCLKEELGRIAAHEKKSQQ